MKKYIHTSKIENMPLQPLQFIPVLDRKPRACQKLGNGPGVGKCPTPGTDKVGKYPAVAQGGGGFGWAQVELTDA